MRHRCVKLATVALQSVSGAPLTPMRETHRLQKREYQLGGCRRIPSCSANREWTADLS